MTEPSSRLALARRGPDAPVAPIRIVHIGLGHFFRAHQAWYTAHATDAAGWGIAAFTGRSPDAAKELTAQDCLYSLVERGPDGDRVEVVTSVSEAVAGSDVTRLTALLADPRVAIVTLTVTERGYRLDPDGRPDLSDGLLVRDLDGLRSGATPPSTVMGRLLAGLRARMAAGSGPIAVVPCDNVPRNGRFVERGLRELAAMVDPALAEWAAANVSFVNTSVDRITPHTAEVPDVVAELGWCDSAAVVTEPFSDWVLAGDFPAGRPDWASAGARFVDDIEPWEHRKLWLLNGAHSILTFAGQLRGLETVAEAVADPQCRALIDAFWADAVRCLPEGTEHVQYRERLVERFTNPRIVHRLDQIALESTAKVRFRIAEVAERTLADGRVPEGVLRALAVWIAWLEAGASRGDAAADQVAEALAAADPVRGLLGLVSPLLADTPLVVDEVTRALASVIPRAAEVRGERAS